MLSRTQNNLKLKNYTFNNGRNIYKFRTSRLQRSDTRTNGLGREHAIGSIR